MRTKPQPSRGSRARLALSTCGLLLAVGASGTQSAATAARGDCEIEFFASSTLHDFTGRARSRPFDLARHVDASDGREWWSASVEVDVADLDTGIDRRDRNMRAMFDVEHFPSIIAEFPHIEIAAYADADGAQSPPLEFQLTIRDVTRPMAARLSHWVRDENGARFDAEFDVSLSSFRLEVPAVLGLLRVADGVTVRAHVTLERSPQTAARPMSHPASSASIPSAS